MAAERSKKTISIPLPSGSALTWVMVALLVVAAFFIGSLWTKVQYLQQAQTAAAQPAAAGAASPTPMPVNVKDVKTDNAPTIGKKDAPLTMAYWFDFQCPFCKQFETTVMPDLIKKYVDTGKMRIVFKDFQFLGDDSTTAGLFEHAVWEAYPDQYMKWHQAMFDKQDAENSGWGSRDDIIALTRTIPGINTSKVVQLVDSKKDQYQKMLDASRTEGPNFGISGTPGFVIGTVAIYGAEPLASFEQTIDAQLKK